MAHTKQPSSWKFKGFTLVELIVVITILAILGTIGFLSVWGYSSRARDSARVGDTSQIAKSLDLSIVTAGDYPMPDNAFSVTYLGGTVWNQGVVGNTVLQFFKSSISGGGLNEKPTDPLKNTEYTYSELAEGRAYQIKVDYEGDLAPTALDNPLVTPAFAAPGDPTIAYIRGNYAGLTAKTTTGGIVYVLAIPSIITNSGTTASGSLRIESNALSGTLLFNGRSLRNATTYNPNARANSGVVFSGTTLPANDSSGQMTNMITALKAAYGSTPDIASNANIANLIAATGSTAIQSLGTTIVSNQLGGVLTVWSTSTTPVNCVGAWSSCSASCTQTYTITTPASWGGSACAAGSGATQSCTGGSCPAAGSCNNATQYACSSGTAINQSAGSCGGSSTWNCTTAGGTSGQCSRANGACCVANQWQVCGSYESGTWRAYCTGWLRSWWSAGDQGSCQSMINTMGDCTSGAPSYSSSSCWFQSYGTSYYYIQCNGSCG